MNTMQSLQIVLEMDNLLLMTVSLLEFTIIFVAGKGYASGYFDNGEDDFGEYPEEDEGSIYAFCFTNSRSLSPW